MRWQITSKPCIHTLFFLNIIGGEEGKVDPYVSEYFSVAKFRAAYADNVPALLGKDQWEVYDPGFKLCPPMLNRAPGRPRVNRLRTAIEGATIKRRPCKRCGIVGYIQRKCNNRVPNQFGDEVEDENTVAAAEADAAAATKMAKEVATEVSARYVCLDRKSVV